ncbi:MULTISPECIES: LysR family transcriptional regulator [Kribbella]|uniref:DNA-binding transcriptional LysR family regulator n=1 Tax=Kribbella pratensis TaxID=2512112 RepID=A0ABY2FMN9_9ACTN|nr:MULTISPECIES: LysR family transcriptional regulator [Kribbella]TDW94136.1 DNA-binding transcriptional LysR family regulator [Kribbella pratensis]TDX02742.1 DNA-binding transcriptional LysR family regulator [Kribbella sp. VKM Ac-2566]
MPEPEIRELRYFRAVAEDLNITRAAERLGIAQPPLSRAMRQLEHRLGVDLFDRSGPRLALTEAGETLLKESGPVLDALDSAVRRTQRAGQSSGGLVVTAKPGVATEVLHRIVTELQDELPGVQVVVSGFGEQADMVRDGRADVALVSRPFDDHGLETELLYTEPRVAALPARHELAAREVLAADDLAGIPAPRWSRANVAERNYWSARPDDSVDGPIVQDSSQLLEVVAFGQAVALVPQSMAERNIRPDVVYRPVTDVEPYQMLVVWPAGSRSADLAKFVEVAVRRSGAP